MKIRIRQFTETMKWLLHALSTSPQPSARTNLQILDPRSLRVLRSPISVSSAGELHLNGSDSATLEEALVLARSNAGKEPDTSLAVSPGTIDSGLHEQIKEVLSGWFKIYNPVVFVLQSLRWIGGDPLWMPSLFASVLLCLRSWLQTQFLARVSARSMS
jgi:hypothetical protein